MLGHPKAQGSRNDCIHAKLGSMATGSHMKARAGEMAMWLEKEMAISMIPFCGESNSNMHMQNMCIYVQIYNCIEIAYT